MLAFSDETVTVELEARFEAGDTDTDVFPDALPPLPSKTVTETVNEVVEVTIGGVKTALFPLPLIVPPDAPQE